MIFYLWYIIEATQEVRVVRVEKADDERVTMRNGGWEDSLAAKVGDDGGRVKAVTALRRSII